MGLEYCCGSDSRLNDVFDATCKEIYSYSAIPSLLLPLLVINILKKFAFTIHTLASIKQTLEEDHTAEFFSPWNHGQMASYVWIPMLSSKWGFRRSLEVIAIAISVGFLLLAFFSPDVGHSLWQSSSAYGKDWYFFSGIYTLMQSILGAFTDNPATIAKALCAVLGGLWFLLLMKWNRSHSRSAHINILFLMLGFYAVIPTLHPWYLLPLLVLGLRFWPYFWSPILWPAATFFSQMFYIDNHMPVVFKQATTL